MKYVCRLHGESYDAVPADAIQIGTGHPASTLYRFADGQIHALKHIGLGRKKAGANAPNPIGGNDE